MIKVERSVAFNLNISLVVACCLGWVFLVRDMELLAGTPELVKNIVLSAVIAGFAWLYRDLSFRITLTRKRFAVLAGLVCCFSLINGHVLLQAVACDELYHVGMASQSVIAIERMIRHGGELAGYMSRRPMTELVSTLNVLLLMFVVGAGIFYRSLLRRINNPSVKTQIRFAFMFVVLVLVGQMFRQFPSRVEIHPPLRLFPLFLAQGVFGYDDFVFRMVSTVALSLIAAIAVDYVTHRVDPSDGSRWLRLAVAILACAVPTVLHAASIVEPSIWCYGTWMTSFFLLSRYFETSDDRFLMGTGVAIALGALMRQNALVLWPVLGLVLLWKRPNWLTWVKALLPVLWFLPFFSHLLFGNHPAKSDHPIKNVLDATLSGKSLSLILQQTTVPWILLALVLMGLVVVQKLWRKEYALIVLLGLFPAFVLYFSINPYLWPLGRYEAEWIAPAIGILALVVAAGLPNYVVKPLAMIAGLAICYSVYTVRELHRDSYYGQWPERRITSESMFPYREAFGHLQQAEKSGQFTFTYGVPIYGEWLLYLRGYSFAEVESHRVLQSKWQNMVESSKTWSDLVQKARAEHIRYNVIQYGNRRELQHRAEWQNVAQAMLKQAAAAPGSGVSRLDTYSGDLEGKIDIYEF